MKKRVLIICLLVLLVSMLPAEAFAAKQVKAKSVTLSAKVITLSVGDAITLNATKSPADSTDSLKWSSSNKDVAKVSKKGLVTAVSAGKATITVKTTSNKTAKCTVYVRNYVTQKEVKDLIKKNTLSESKANTLIKDQLAKSGYIDENKAGDIVNDILSKKNYVTTADVETMLAAMETNTCDCEGKYYSKAEVDALLVELSNNITSSQSGIDWEDGTEIPLYSKQELPFTMPVFRSVDDKTITIDEVRLKKYHYDAFDGCSYMRFRMVLYIKGSYDSTYGDFPAGSISMALLNGDDVVEYKTLWCEDYSNHFTVSEDSFEMTVNYVTNSIGDSYLLYNADAEAIGQ